MTEHFASALSGRSFINPVTNETVISSFRAGRHVEGLIHRHMPPDCLPAFLHEATHHWCFMHTVGLAVSLMHQRALTDAAAYRSKFDKDVARRLTGTMMRYEAFIALQRPLAEGLALYAEFDLSSHGTLPQLSTVLARVADYFGPSVIASFKPEEHRDAVTRNVLDLVLGSRRREPDVVGRRCDVLVRPADPEDGGYLPGYLLVKALWSVGMGVDARLGDPELFFAYAIAYFYTDLGLIAHLLDEDDDLRAVDRLIEYFVGRVVEFGLSDHAKQIDDFIENHRNRTTYTEFADWARHGNVRWSVDDATADLGADRLVALHDETLQGDDVVRNVALMFQRSVLSLGRHAVSVAVDENDRYTVTDGEHVVMTGKCTFDLPTGTTVDGHVDVSIDAHSGCAAIELTIGDGAPGYWFSDDASEDWRQSFLNTRAALSRAEGEAQEFLVLLRDVARQAAGVMYPLEIARDRATSATEVFTRLATAVFMAAMEERVPDFEAVDRSVDLLEHKGLAGVFDKIRHVRALAWGGLVMSTGALPDVDSARRLFEEDRDIHGVAETFDETVDLICRTGKEKLGNPLYTVRGGRPLFIL
ncbi:hypothetical protein [Kutzneria buriramensis]|uniref:Uncharacterized protein n=1 Tax=Kutzneria buriramensis TaxID=1045776 RepID=A0A3E0HP86_9PSEU|nr:hypothetical protein [Kutzneria buriramensis]REH48248.1 hypothetical protein BCF44_105106 [Kutzneria buriramensis]